VALGLFWMVNIALAVLSAALLVGVVGVYARNARELRSPLTLGLVAFGCLFLAQSLLSVYVYVSMNDQGMGANVAVPMLALNAAGLGGFAALFYVTWR